MLPVLLGQIDPTEALLSVSGDGAYDTKACHEAIARRAAQAIIPVRKNARKPWKVNSFICPCGENPRPCGQHRRTWSRGCRARPVQRAAIFSMLEYCTNIIRPWLQPEFMWAADRSMGDRRRCYTARLSPYNQVRPQRLTHSHDISYRSSDTGADRTAD